MPVDFEEVHVSSNADEEDIRNAIMAIRRNRVALKGERGGQDGALCTIPFISKLTHTCCWGCTTLTLGIFWPGRTLVLGEWTEASGVRLGAWWH